MLSWKRLLKVLSHSQTVDCYAEKERREGGKKGGREERRKQKKERSRSLYGYQVIPREN